MGRGRSKERVAKGERRNVWESVDLGLGFFFSIDI